MIRKFWNAASWSNLSAHSPAINPSEPSMPAPSAAKMMIHHGCASDSGANHAVTTKTPRPTVSPRTIDAPT